MRKSLVSFLAASLTWMGAGAQSIWPRPHLERVKSEITRPMYSVAYRSLLSGADSILALRPLSVMDKEGTAPGGDNHDYTSLARYFHPDPDSPDGLPYINRDGVTNPEIGKWDRNNLGATSERVTTLALAWFLSGNERYAAKAADLIDSWFLDPATAMHPHFEYAQMVPGVNGGKGRAFGVLDGYSFVEMLDGVALLDGSKSWTKKRDRQLKEWMSSLLDWLLDSPQGKEEAAQPNNHSTAYDAQVMAIAMFVGREDVARRIAAEFPRKRIFAQIDPDGRQPHEMWRTLSFGYSQYNLTHMIDIFLMARKLGLEIDKSVDSQGRSFYKALDFMASYLGRPVEEWEGEQISGWEEKQQELLRDLWRVSSLLDPSRDDYRTAYRDHRVFNPTARFTLLYYTPDRYDDIFTELASSLSCQVGRVAEERKRGDNRSAHKVNPRTVNADGSLALVHPHDWTSGFFPGELWMMYEFTNDPRWREEAVSSTWVIEEAKNHGGTHDLGFMIGDSFGKGWELTGERSYFDVVCRAATTLAGQFNPTVGAIRSWDHNAAEWRYPVIIDNMMNLEMLFKVSEATGDRRFRDIAVSHADVTLRNHFRPDHSSFHVVDYDPGDGTVRSRVTAQGYSDDSFWSRGQGWGLYGYTMCYRYTKEDRKSVV